MFDKSNPTVATMGIDIGKNSFHVVGLDQRGAIVLRQKWSRGQVEVHSSKYAPKSQLRNWVGAVNYWVLRADF
jgi:hypothetical protein